MKRTVKIGRWSLTLSNEDKSIFGSLTEAHVYKPHNVTFQGGEPIPARHYDNELLKGES